MVNEPPASRQARDAVADRGRDEEDRSQLRAGRAVARLRDSRRQPDHRAAELLRRGDRRGPVAGSGKLGMSQQLLVALVVVPTALVVVALFGIMWRERTSPHS